MVKHTSASGFLIVLIFISIQSLAGGFQMNMLGMKATSMGGAFTGFARDASGVFYNPGAMTFSEYTQISLGASFVIPSTSFLSPYAGNTNMENNWQVPMHFYGNTKINERTSVGLSVNTPFNLHTEWDDNWTGRYLVKESQMRGIYFQPSVSYQFSEKFGVGGGPVIAFGKSFLTKSLPYSSSAGEVGMELDGRSVGFGFNIGLYLETSEELSFGFTYRSAVKMNVNEGDASFSNVPASLGSMIPSSTDFETSYTLPSVISAGAAYELTRELTLCLDINYTTWNSFDQLDYTFDDYSQLNFTSIKNYENAFAIRLGAQYEISDRIDAR